MITGNWRDVLRIFFLPVVLSIILFVAILFVLTWLLGEGVLPLVAIAMAVAYLVVSTWCIVSWHRFVLEEERPKKWFPPFQFGVIFGYWLRGLALGLILMVTTVPVLMVVLPLAGKLSPVFVSVVGGVCLLAVVVFVLRLSPILPAAAVENPIPMREAFRATKSGTWALASIAFVFGSAQVGLNLASEHFAATENLLGILLTFAGILVSALINVSLLTTLYGHYVEGRTID